MNSRPPAESLPLPELREIFRDPLLVRVGRHLALTRYAEELIVPLREALDRIVMTLRQKARFDPRVDVRTFSISAPDYAVFVLLAPFVRAVASEAPNVTIHLLHNNG
jgi:LysR family transcriptional regulator, nod-box dependent transcriptional activator